MDEKSDLPPYAAAASSFTPLPAPGTTSTSTRRLAGGRLRRSRAIKFVALACMVLLVLSQWKQSWYAERAATRLSEARLLADLASCRKLQAKPQDPIGLGRERNARYVDGGRPTLIKNATIWIGEPVHGTSEADARAGKGWQWISGDVYLEHGLVRRVESAITVGSVATNTLVVDARGRLLTAGIIDMHSHAGVGPLPGLDGDEDTNEMSDDVTPWARSIDGLHPDDVQIQVIKSGGVTTSLILPGSGNNIGGEAFVVKHAVGPKDGRPETSAADMLADPDRTWRYMKMACGENAKRVHGGIDRSPYSRMGESYRFRRAFETAGALVTKQDDWCRKAEAIGAENMDEYLPQDLKWESLSAVLRGQVHVNTHCYKIADLEAMVDHSNEFQFPIRAFHHAHQTYLVPEILKRTWGGRAPASALFADNMYYKAEAYVGSEHAGKYLYDQGLTPVYVSDNPVLNAQHVLFEAAKAYHWGLPYHAALASVTSAPAELLGLGRRLGKVKPGFDADIALWDSDPLSVGAAPVQVWIDGVAQFSKPVELEKDNQGPMQPDSRLADIPPEEPVVVETALFTGITKVLLDLPSPHDAALAAAEAAGVPFNVAVRDGKISCVGECAAATEGANATVVSLRNGHLHKAFTTFGNLGLVEIAAEDSTNNGVTSAFTRAVDGLQLGGKVLGVAGRYGVTRAISPPLSTSGPFGVSAAFITTAETSIESGAVFASDAAVHYSLDLGAKSSGHSYAEVFGELRRKLLAAAAPKDSDGSSGNATDPYAESEYLRRVVAGDIVLAVTVSSADGIAALLRVKSDIEAATSTPLRVAVIGGAESHLLAKELAAASVGVVLAPLQQLGASWDTRRALVGAPLDAGTVVDVLAAAGVVVAVGLAEEWRVRDVAFEAGAAWRNGGGKISRREALDIVSTNAYRVLGLEEPEEHRGAHWVVSEGDPLDIGARIKAVGAGRGTVSIY
ncbi:carbohydrate esterase family 9 protein [Cordyceps fumosorosea ARSEF 2679]|uniref:Carbohydrate esterase family 9 protein n=1 Tax=Cordyceps fumosorosea (strain ARSEF 2679) TaxID=1081104 RepID=A0A167M3Q0_CORFA|nr:carbohydrate esterase family 9 protein [Cordyceps fumosorosea ARSEF 2679]OAA53882.1 carbohydrate esterase family 9 protein [Cordyceps fumosorosea ARSEF 2679]